MIGGPGLGRQEYDLRLERLASEFEGRYGEVRYGHVESVSGERRRLKVTVTIPGWGLPAAAAMVFVEKHEWVDPDWVPYAYAYDLHLEPEPNGRFAYHWDRGIFHVHCEDRTQPTSGPHFKGAPLDDIFWATESLFEVVSRGISCHGLPPLIGWNEEP